MKILITGLSGSGKTTLAGVLEKLIPNVIVFNGDMIRAIYNDNDFSPYGRIVQATRMLELANNEEHFRTVIVDFICPTEETRSIISADYVIFMNTITSSQYSDTDALYEIPKNADIEVITKDAIKWAIIVTKNLRSKFPQLFDILPKT